MMFTVMTMMRETRKGKKGSKARRKMEVMVKEADELAVGPREEQIVVVSRFPCAHQRD